MWWRVFADGTEVDIINAQTAEQAIAICKVQQESEGYTTEGVHWTTKRYG